MAEVKKRQKPEGQQTLTELVEAVPDPLKELDGLKITVGDKEYPVPKLKFGQYTKILEWFDEVFKDPNISELENLRLTQEFYYKILKPIDNTITKKALEDMPLYQYASEYVIKVKMALFRAPLVS
jgi:hypothetical protein